MIVIDTYRLREDPSDLDQLDWIDSISYSISTPWKIMIGHPPLYSYGYHGEDILMQDLLENVLEESDIDLYISGHDHDLQHLKSDGITNFFISGSAAKTRDTDTGELSLFSSSEHGFLTIQLSRHILHSYFINKEGEVIYSYTIFKE